MNQVKMSDRETLERIVFLEGELLDEKRFEEWLDLYTEDAIYWVPATPGQKSPENHVSLFYDDKQTMLARVTRLRHPEIHAQLPASRTCRIITNVAVEAAAGSAASLDVTSSHMIVEYRPGWEQRIFAGRCRHTLRHEGGRWRIARKRFDLINCDAAFAALTVPL
ncbi:MAG: aromatic-ring-hydroxylating dioxygenase subunit beta [Rhodospirillaceae bacterium]|nr:aromatic-ring-hydroxylating dioxygenase subunit beta [Rhodospirillaceae bacterium]